MRALIPFLFASGMLSAASGQAPPRVIGVAAPLSGPAALLGSQVAAGAAAAAAQAGAVRAGVAQIRLEMADDRCSAEGGRQAAERFVAAKADAAIGFLCTEALDAAMPLLHAAGIPVITVGVRADALTDARPKTGWTVARLAPRADAEAQAAGQLLLPRWGAVPFAIVDDGTIYGRDLAEGVREAVEAAGLKPAFTDTFRPGAESQAALAARLAQNHVAELFVGGDRGDAAVIARNALARSPGIVVIGGEALQDEPGPAPLARGTLSVGLPDPAAAAPPEAAAAIRAQGREPEGYALPAFAAVEIAEKVLTEGGAPGASRFDGRTFDTVVGSVSFDGKGDLAGNPFRLLQFDGERFLPPDLP